MSIFGFIITIAINILFIPHFSYMACAWASFIANLSMMLISYYLGQKNYPIPYNLKSAGFFFLLSMILFAGITLTYMHVGNIWLRLGINSLFIATYLFIVLKKELSLHSLPLIGKYFKN
jgi:peptidoglycan biosynthesis protein MviN/MurJ (putative lipid II flippase)